ncbi:MAG: hypothetical protein ACLRG3_03625 [Bifidobacterium adolescentis]
MSVRAVSWAYGLNLGSMTQKAVLLYLAYRAREEDDCAWPSVNLIQVETELSERGEDVQTAYTGRSVRS